MVTGSRAIRRRRAWIATLVPLVGGPLVAWACKSTEPIPSCSDPSFAPNGEGVFLSVTAGTTPTISWSPACLAYRLVVQDSAGAATLWDVRSDVGSTMEPGVTYGVVPQGRYTQTQAAVPLQKGTQYSVGLYRYYLGSPTASDVIGALLFRP